MIGIFDSGLGGLTVLRKLVDELPECSYLYLGDNARAPYGPRDLEEIYQFTQQGVDWLFCQGAELVILACNTASANALRRLQQEWLPKMHPHKRVLGIVVPTVEQVTGVAWHSDEVRDTDPGHIVVFATQATVRSGAYAREIMKRNPRMKVWQHSCPGLVELIEGDAPREQIRHAVRRCVGDIAAEMSALNVWPPKAMLLGCTHYPIVADMFFDVLPKGPVIYDQPSIVASKLREYFLRHPEFAAKCAIGPKVHAVTTGDAKLVNMLAGKFYGKPITFDHIDLPDYVDVVR